jgi:hypothetical protein
MKPTKKECDKIKKKFVKRINEAESYRGKQYTESEVNIARLFYQLGCIDK